MPPKQKFDRSAGMPTDPLPGFNTKGHMNELAYGIVYGLAYAGVPFKTIGKLCKCPSSTVGRVVAKVGKRLEEADEARPSPEKHGPTRSDTPPATDEDEDEQAQSTSSSDDENAGPPAPPDGADDFAVAVWEEMHRRAEDGSWEHRSSRDIRRALADKGEFVVSVRTIQRRVSELGGEWVRRPVTGPLSEDRKAIRVARATQLLKMLEDDPTLMDRIVFTDESILRAEDMQTHALRRPGFPVEPRRKQRWNAQVMVWGAIGIGLKHLVFIRENVNADNYTKLLQSVLLDEEETHFKRDKRVLMHDGASPHTAKVTQQFLEDNGIEVIPWAAYSPDWNPIENLWSILKRRMNMTCFDDKTRLEEVAYKAWSEVDKDLIERLCRDFKNRLEITVARGGEDSLI